MVALSEDTSKGLQRQILMCSMRVIKRCDHMCFVVAHPNNAFEEIPDASLLISFRDGGERVKNGQIGTGFRTKGSIH